MSYPHFRQIGSASSMRISHSGSACLPSLLPTSLFPRHRLFASPNRTRPCSVREGNGSVCIRYGRFPMVLLSAQYRLGRGNFAHARCPYVFTCSIDDDSERSVPQNRIPRASSTRNRASNMQGAPRLPANMAVPPSSSLPLSSSSSPSLFLLPLHTEDTH